MSSSRYPTKRPRMMPADREDEATDTNDNIETEEDKSSSYQPFAEAGSNMVGLVCPRCRAICRGPEDLKAHMATECPHLQDHDGLMRRDQARPVQQVTFF